MNNLFKKCLTLILIPLGLSVFGQDKTRETPSVIEENESKAEQLFIEGIGHYIQEDYEKALKNYKEAASLSKNNAALEYRLAEIYFLKGQQFSALTHAKKAIELDDSKVPYYLLLADIYQQQQNYDATLEIYQKLLKNNPKALDYHFDLAEIHLFLAKNSLNEMNQLKSGGVIKGKKKKALKKEKETLFHHLDKALKSYNVLEKKYGINEEIIKQKQKIYLLKEEPQNVIAESKKLIEANPDDITFKLDLARFYLSQDKHEHALSYLNTLRDENPNESGIRLLLHDYYKKQGNDEKALEELTYAFKDKKLDAEPKIKLINSYLKNGQDEAITSKIKELSDIIAETHPEQAMVHAVRGDVHFNFGSKEKALSSYLKALEKDNSHFPIWQQVILLDAELNKIDSLVAHTERALDLFPNQSVFWYYNGLGHSIKKRPKKAVEAFEQGKMLSITDPALEAQFNAQLGDAYHGIKEYSKSNKAYQAVLDYDPNNAHVLNNYSYFLSLRKENLSRAKKMGKQLVALYPEEATYLDTYGWVLYQMGEYKEAREYLQKAYENSTNGTITEHLGDVYYQLGEKDKALMYWKEAKEQGETSENLDRKIEDQKLYE